MVSASDLDHNVLCSGHSGGRIQLTTAQFFIAQSLSFSLSLSRFDLMLKGMSNTKSSSIVKLFKIFLSYGL